MGKPSALFVVYWEFCQSLLSQPLILWLIFRFLCSILWTSMVLLPNGLQPVCPALRLKLFGIVSNYLFVICSLYVTFAIRASVSWKLNLLITKMFSIYFQRNGIESYLQLWSFNAFNTPCECQIGRKSVHELISANWLLNCFVFVCCPLFFFVISEKLLSKKMKKISHISWISFLQYWNFCRVL